MAASFLTAAQRDRYGRYPDVVTPDDLSRCFHLSDDDRAQIMSCPRAHQHAGRHSFVMPEAVAKGELRPLRNPADDPD
jgi:hypothetical protein